ncbi:MAG: hypothetical protein ABWY49_09230 [Rhizobium sp.]
MWILSVGDRAAVVVFRARLDGAEDRLGEIIFLFSNKLQLESHADDALHTLVARRPS